MPDSAIIFREPIEHFASACGGQRPLTLSVRRWKDHESIATQSFDQPFIRVGRSVNNDLVLSDQGVSFRHLYLQLIEGKWSCVDLHSRVRASERVREPAPMIWLDDSRQLKMGPYLLQASHAAAEPAEPSSQPLPHGLAPLVSGYSLELVNRPGYPPRRITRPVTLVGSSPQCDLWLKNPGISKIHASLVLTPRGLWIVDLLGRNGIMVDGRRIRWQQIDDGSRLEIGRFQFQVRLETAKSTTLYAPPAAMSPMEPIEGGLTREFVLGVLEHLTESRSQFFEYVQYQSNLIHDLMSQLRLSQTAAIGTDMLRIQEINRELTELKIQLARINTAPAEPVADRPSSPGDDDAVENAGQDGALNSSPVTEEITQIRTDFDLPVKDHRHSETRGSERPTPPAASDSSLTPSSWEIQHVHASISQRLSRLSHDRNSSWKRLLRFFGSH